MRYDFSGKTALITGASRGIGAATALALAANGAKRIVLHYNSFREGAETTASQISNSGGQVTLIQSDLASLDGIHQLIDRVKSEAPEVDILVNNAGHLVARAKLLEFSGELYDQVMNLNVKSLWFLTQAVVP